MADELEQSLDGTLETNPETTASTGASDDLASKDALIAKLRRENADKRVKANAAIAEADALKAQLAKVDTIAQSVEALTRQLEQAETARKNAEMQTLRLQVATTVGLPPELAARLQGSTMEELQADAQQLASVLPKGALVVPKVGQGAEQPLPSRARDIHSRILGTSNSVFSPEANLAIGGGIVKND